MGRRGKNPVRLIIGVREGSRGGLRVDFIDVGVYVVGKIDLSYINEIIMDLKGLRFV